MDWLLGRFASQSVPDMDQTTLDAFETLLALPDPEIEAWIRRTSPVAPEGELAVLIGAVQRFHGLD